MRPAFFRFAATAGKTRISAIFLWDFLLAGAFIFQSVARAAFPA